MSDIIINIENFKRSSKRLQKALKLNGLDIGLTQSQDILSKAFGVKNTFEMLNLLNDSNIEHVINEKLDFEDNFINKFMNIIKSSKTIKKSYLYTDYGNFIIDIVSNNKESYGIYFGATSKPRFKDFTDIGIDVDTSNSLIKLISEIPEDKYEGLLLGSKLFKKYCKDKNVYYFKNDLFDEERTIKESVYTKRYTIIKKSKLNDIIIDYDKSLKLNKMKSNSYPGFEDFNTAVKMLKNNDQILVEYYYESYIFDRSVPNCFAIKLWELNSDNDLVIININKAT